ncbi:MAG: DUF433 domain-containing protein [Spirulinaceae cyanobacterium RM2_2_10]|nr:DUF433 domain-containing protein [Spirulinaceae cyanobacterium SM2_1_0]NJO19580.1 DUF433 domain-containing protein [Spirulinaceae cyanobacterium RM2_2_10]
MTDIYGGKDPRHIPAYSIPDAARYLKIPSATLRSWVCGRFYTTQQGKQWLKPLIELPDADSGQISFINLIEAHVLRIIRVVHSVELKKVRDALDYIDEKWGKPHSLAHYQFETDGIELFIETLHNFINVSRGGQLTMREALKGLLERVEWDEDQLAARIFMGVTGISPDAQCPIIIDPRVSFGRPLLVGVGVSTAVVTDAFNAGDRIGAIAADYDCTPAQIQAAIQFESQQLAA